MEAFFMQRKNLSPTFTDAAVLDLGGPRTTRFLQLCEALICWKEMVEVIAPLFPEHEQGGRPFWPALVMIKCVLLLKWFGLVDTQVDEMFVVRLVYQVTVGM